MKDIDFCPHCGADFRGEPIPEDQQELFGNEKYFSRLMGIEDCTYDGISWWCCPDCYVVWDRFSGRINTRMKEEEWFKASILKHKK